MTDDDITDDVSDGDSNGDGDGAPSITMDSPVAASTPIRPSESSDDPVYGSRQQRLKERTERDSDSTADDTDVRQLFETPTLDKIRWQYRNNGIAATVVDKPIEDAFKHGLTFDDDSFDDWYQDTYKSVQQTARIKARRDGVAAAFWVLDDTGSIQDSPSDVENVNGVADIRVITLDDLAVGEGDPRQRVQSSNEVASARVASKHLDYDDDQLVVTRSGLVVVDDVTSIDHENFVGVVYERNPQLAADDEVYEFIHADRLDLYVSRQYVDGDMHNSNYGFVEGDSVLSPIFHALTGITKAEWALGQTLLRYTAPLHAIEISENVTPSEGDWETHIEELNKEIDNINNKSNLTLPPGHSIDTHGLGAEIDPEPFLNGLIDDVCAGSEFTKSVLFGSAAGTVSGQSTDIKNYFNEVQVYRHNTAVEKQEDVAQKANAWVDDISVDPTDVDPDWGPLFKVDELDRLEGMRTLVSTVSSGVTNYVLSLDEARDLIRELSDVIDADVELDDITEDDLDQLDRINTQKGKQYPEGESSEQEVESGTQSPRQGQNGGGREGNSTDPNTTDPSNPAQSSGRETES